MVPSDLNTDHFGYRPTAFYFNKHLEALIATFSDFLNAATTVRFENVR